MSEQPTAPAIKTLRVCWSGAPDPTIGTRIASKGGRLIYEVISVQHLHRALLSSRPRLKLVAYAKPVEDLDLDVVARALPWQLTARRAGPGTQKHPAAKQTANANAAARLEQGRNAQLRAVQLRHRAADADRFPGAPEPTRQDPTGAGRVDLGEWTCPEDAADPDRKTAEPRKITGFRTGDSLIRMMRRPGSQILPEYITAANKLRLAWDISRIGLSGSAGWNPATTYVTPMPKHGHGKLADERNVRAREVKTVFYLIGPRRALMLRSIVCENHDIATWCRAEWERRGRTRVSPDQEMGKLLGVLMTLADIYAGQIRLDALTGNLPA